jgi:GTP-binding protein
MSVFCDETQIKITAGNGGNGCVAFRRERFIAKGGPNGGNGGRGGNIIFKVNKNLNTLTHLDSKKQFKAKNGKMGLGQLKNGKSAEDLTLEVPLGTLISDAETGDLLCDLNSENISFVAAQGGRGGYGNAHFKSSIRQAPKFAEKGEEGEEFELKLELKLVADVAIIGMPSCGKSTLISVISNAKPKIASYPFTTLIPHLGVTMIHGREVVFADIPGLIEGAHRGKGLGHEFLRHIERTKILIHLIDPLSEEDILKNFELINQELKLFNPDLATKPQVVAVNKIDALTEEQIEDLKKKLKKLNPFFISAVTQKNLKELLDKTLDELKNYESKLPAPDFNLPDKKVFRPHLEDPRYFSTEKIEEGIYKVVGGRIEQLVSMTDMDNHEAVFRAYDVMKKMGIQKELKKMGVKEGDKIKIGKNTLEFHEV